MTKRILSVVLVLTMIFSLGAVSFTADAATTKSYSMTTQSSMRIAIVTVDGLRLRNGASTNATALAWMEKGAKVLVYPGYLPGGFCRVLYNGQSGYCSSVYLYFTSTYTY